MVFYPNYFLLQYVCHLILIIILLLILMDMMQSLVPMEKQVGNICLADSVTTHIILQDSKYFTHLSHYEGHVTPLILMVGVLRPKILSMAMTTLIILTSSTSIMHVIIYSIHLRDCCCISRSSLIILHQ